jgi:SAM-dependent methyltransferase
MSDRQRILANTQGELSSARADDWADLQEPQHRLKYEDAIRRTRLGPGQVVLDLGCGAGVFCRLASEAGASVTGIDAAPALVEIARDRVPDGRFDVGDMQTLPYVDSSFDVVTAFNSLQFVPDPLAVLAEVRRVARPETSIYVLVWGRQEKTQLVAVMKALHPLMPPRPPGGPGAFVLSPPGVLEEFVTRSGFTLTETGYLELPYQYPDQATMLRAQCSSAPAVLAAGPPAKPRSGKHSRTHSIRTALPRVATASKTSTATSPPQPQLQARGIDLQRYLDPAVPLCDRPGGLFGMRTVAAPRFTGAVRAWPLA